MILIIENQGFWNNKQIKNRKKEKNMKAFTKITKQ